MFNSCHTVFRAHGPPSQRAASRCTTKPGASSSNATEEWQRQLDVRLAGAIRISRN
ncbi:hypothetical protein HBI24_209400 [Parastagonospora nodorum]|nr:hypothetical protein HBI95_218860 [Parastagonospora nodorum]KAH5100711.1 hypothetical protein HBH71_228300 [Parastagonospora nodorum]KAH5572519.1 hypothetical protein HBI24_209400 [Parastagonospora nodorum]KAH5727514.1 hypothetical protein HBI17_232540 [Parastagonospora nodorum]